MIVGGGARRAQLEHWGVDRAALNRMLRRGMLYRPARGYYVLPWSGDGDDRWQRQRSEHLRAVSAVAGNASVAGLRSAALALGLPVSRVPPIPEVLRPPHAAPLKGARVIRRWPSPQVVVLVNQVPVTSLERTAVDIALDLPTPEALITVDAALRRGADPHLMSAILEDLGQVRGCHRARRTLHWADGHSESPLESRGRGELMVQGLPRPWCNVTFCFAGVEVRPDHWWHHLGIAGEADGRGSMTHPRRRSTRSGPRSYARSGSRRNWGSSWCGTSIGRSARHRRQWRLGGGAEKRDAIASRGRHRLDWRSSNDHTQARTTRFAGFGVEMKVRRVSDAESAAKLA